MFRKIEKATLLALWKKLLLTGLMGYAVLATVLLLRLKPRPLLIGVDPYGTRIIRESGDRLLKKEKENFLKRFVSLLYQYDAESYNQRVSDAGEMMTQNLWNARKPAFVQLATRLKTEALSQIVAIQSLREVDEATYQADLLLRIERKLVETQVKLRLELRLRPSLRRETNPYPFEVENYEESQGS